jgi:hypothetical protein
MKLRYKIGNWASKKSFRYYTKNNHSYLNLPKYLEVLVLWGTKGFTIIESIKGHWVIR